MADERDVRRVKPNDNWQLCKEDYQPDNYQLGKPSNKYQRDDVAASREEQQQPDNKQSYMTSINLTDHQLIS